MWFQTCTGMKNSLLALRTFLYPSRSLKGRHTDLERASIRTWESVLFEHCRFTRSIICERVFASPVSGPSRGVFFSRRSRELQQGWKTPGFIGGFVRRKLRCIGKKGTNPSLPDFETRAALSLRFYKKFDRFWWMHFSSCVLLRTLSWKRAAHSLLNG